MPGGRPFRIISRIIGKRPPVSSFAAGFTDATSNWGLAGGVCARRFAQIKASAVHTTYRIVNLLTLLGETHTDNANWREFYMTGRPASFVQTPLVTRKFRESRLS